MFWNQFGDFINLNPDTINPDPHHWYMIYVYCIYVYIYVYSYTDVAQKCVVCVGANFPGILFWIAEFPLYRCISINILPPGAGRSDISGRRKLFVPGFAPCIPHKIIFFRIRPLIRFWSLLFFMPPKLFKKCT